MRYRKMARSRGKLAKMIRREENCLNIYRFKDVIDALEEEIAYVEDSQNKQKSFNAAIKLQDRAIRLRNCVDFLKEIWAENPEIE